MDFCDCGAFLTFALDTMHDVLCSEIRQLRDEEPASEAEALERWLDDGGKLNFLKAWHLNVDSLKSDTL